MNRWVLGYSKKSSTLASNVSTPQCTIELVKRLGQSSLVPEWFGILDEPVRRVRTVSKSGLTEAVHLYKPNRTEPRFEPVGPTL